MKLYLTVIGIAMAVIAAANLVFGVAVWYYVIIGVIWCTALQFAFDGIIAITVNNLPLSWFKGEGRFFRVSNWEKSLYKKLRVRKWKDKVWELGGLGGFSKRKIEDPRSPQYVERFIVECNKGVVTHRLSYFIGYLAMPTMSGVCIYTIGLPVAFVNMVLNILPTIVLRDNTPKLRSLLERMRRAEVKKVKSEK
ncbi:MAG: hypothetical protein IJ445_02875 [Clostridia bacterium]|nr:hypothetical protein [Clostridia bacterium]